MRGYIVLGQTVVAVQLAVRSTMTNALLAALLQHLDDCQTADSLIDRAIHPELVACHELAMVLAPGTETSVGSEETSLITPFVAEPMPAAKEAVVQRWRSKVVNIASINDWLLIFGVGRGVCTRHHQLTATRATLRATKAGRSSPIARTDLTKPGSPARG